MTVERARSAQAARSQSDTMKLRLEGFLPQSRGLACTGQFLPGMHVLILLCIVTYILSLHAFNI